MFYLVNEYNKIVGHFTKLSKDKYQLYLYKNNYPPISRDVLLQKLYEMDLDVMVA